MTNRSGPATFLVATIMVALTLGSPGLSHAKKPKLRATIDGKAYKYRGRYVVGSTSLSGTIAIATKPVRRLGKIVRTIGVGCAYYLPNETFPLVANPDYCNASLTELRVGGSVDTKGWLAVSGVQVTYLTFDGTWATGTFSGILDPLVGTDATAPVTIDGTFRVKLTQ